MKILYPLALLLSICILLAGCQSNTSKKKRNLSKGNYSRHYQGHFKVGKKYKIKRKVYRPRKVTRYNKVGVASWYGSRYGFHGKKTANGDVYNKNFLTAAHKTMQLPSLVKVTNLNNGRSLIVLVNDRGPFSRNREIDLSERAATLLGFRHKGTAKVRVKYLHGETQKFLSSIGMKPREGARAKKPLPRCSLNCHIKLVNLKHGIGVKKT